MIYCLTGKIVKKSMSAVVLSCGGVGYYAQCPASVAGVFFNVREEAEIYTVMKLGMAHPMGPLQLADFIGLDTCLAIMRVLHEGFGNPKYAPCPLLVQMVTAGKLGVKSGEGFYQYTAGSKDLMVAAAFAK